MTNTPSTLFANSWENFWKSSEQKSEKSTTMPCFGGQAAHLSRHWQTLLQPFISSVSQDDVVIDVAAGNGVVIYSLLHLLNQSGCPEMPKLICTDYSLSACQEATSRDRRITAVCAQSETLPFVDGVANLVLSQFGIEYSGDVGFAEAFRLLNSKGRFCAICHIKEGVIYNECLTHFNASLAFEDTNIFASAEVVFTQANLVLEGRASQASFVEADRVFSQSVNACKQIFGRYGKDVCAGYLFQIFVDLGKMFNNIQQYPLSDVLTWLENNRKEIRAYNERMESMTQSALSEEDINTIFNNIQSSHTDCAIHWQYSPLLPEISESNGSDDNKTAAIAWVIEATK